MEKNEADYGKFLAALRNFRRDEAEVRPTSHTSSVCSSDWKAIESAIAAE